MKPAPISLSSLTYKKPPGLPELFAQRQVAQWGPHFVTVAGAAKPSWLACEQLLERALCLFC